MIDYALSYSGIKTYRQCPRQYHETRVIKIWPREDTQATLYGKDVHSACENYVKSGAELGPHSRFKPLLDALMALRGDKYCELKFAVDQKLQSVDFDDPTALFRGVADLVIVDGKAARVIDYKTGGDKYPDPDQLHLMALFIFAHFPQVDEVKAALLFIVHDTSYELTFNRHNQREMWLEWGKHAIHIDNAHQNNVWNPKSSGLCPWCPVKTCEFWREKPKGRR